MIQRQLSNYVLTSIRSNSYKSYFKFIIILARDITLKQGLITCGMTSLFVNVIFLLTGRKIKLVLTVIFQIKVIGGTGLKLRECTLLI